MTKYKPSAGMLELRKEGKLWPCKGLASIVADARKLGYSASVDIGYVGEPDYWQEVNSKNVVLAVNEMDECSISFDREGEFSVGMLVVPSNAEDWLCDYHCSPWLEALIEKHMEI